MIEDDYLQLITSEHRNSPKFVETVRVSVAPFAKLQEILKSLPEKFDIDSAVGVQLDILGIWIGRSRRIKIPMTGVYFSWRDTVETGWRSGVWQGKFDPTTGLYSFPDDSYRKLLKAKIAANSWDGSIPGAYSAWQSAFNTGSYIIIQDNHDMSMNIALVGEFLSIVDQQILQQGLIPLKPEGVRINHYAILPTEPEKLFAWRAEETDQVGGWRIGSFPNRLVI